MKRPDNLPDENVLQGLMDELDTMLRSIPETQRRLMTLTGVGWSADRMVQVEVGPRGQLVGLQIDPRVFRTPDARGLEESILTAAAEAVRQVGEQASEIVGGQVPPDVAELRAQFQPDAADPITQMLLTDVEILAQRREADG